MFLNENSLLWVSLLIDGSPKVLPFGLASVKVITWFCFFSGFCMGQYGWSQLFNLYDISSYSGKLRWAYPFSSYKIRQAAEQGLSQGCPLSFTAEQGFELRSDWFRSNTLSSIPHWQPQGTFRRDFLTLYLSTNVWRLLRKWRWGSAARGIPPGVLHTAWWL